MPSSFLSVLLLALVVVLPVAFGQEKPVLPLKYNGGALLTGNVDVAILWYGSVTKTQKNKILAFLKSINAMGGPQPSVATWWQVVQGYQTFANKPTGPIKLNIVNQKDDTGYSQGRVLVKDMIENLITAATGGNPSILTIIVASDGVSVQDMCAGSCWQHGSIEINEKPFPYVAVGNPEKECPICAWPFVKDIHTPKAPLLRPPSANIGVDAMVMSLAAGLAGAVTNPYEDGFTAVYKGNDIDASAVCKGIFGSGAAPGIPGKFLIDKKFGGAFNAYGIGYFGHQVAETPAIKPAKVFRPPGGGNTFAALMPVPVWTRAPNHHISRVNSQHPDR
ncbi:protein EXORDIUM-like 6 [Senna tora]|uniref:Protein EXORDIUM-like 6 n=1 Tax=Senna tora TaxID=362788 RepID=A0A834XA93_9FABA|nr:protein EXORDIUM-like 6 [Senna tora]